MANRFHSIKSGGFFNIRYIFGGILCLLLLVLSTCGKDSPTKPSPPAPPTPVATRITVIPASANLIVNGQTVQLRATVFDQNNNTIAGASVVWSSSNTVVASVGVQGLVTALKNGTSQITAQTGSVSGVATVTVMAPLPNQSPAAVDTIAAQVLIEGGSPVEVGVSGSFRDPDGDALSYAAESSDDLVATATVSGARVTIRPVSAGSAAVMVTATDPGGLKATQNIAVTVEPPENQPPQAVGLIAAQVLIEGGSQVTVGISGSFRDPDGNALSYAAESSDDLVATATVSGSEVTIRPVSAGSATVTVTATDPGGLKATQNIAVTVEPPENRPPRAVGTIAAQVLIEGGSQVTVGVSGSFRDPDGDALSYAAESSDDLVATATVSGARVTIRPVSAGSAAVTVTATDPGGLKATQNIAVTVEPPENQPPQAVGLIAAQVLIEGGSQVTVGISGSFRDPDGNALSYAAESSDDLVATATVSGSEVTIRPVSAGSATVTVTATDPGGLKATQDIAVTVEPPENRPPQAVGLIAAQVLTEGGSRVTVGVSGAFRDPDGDALSYAAESSDDLVATATVSGARVTIRPVSAGNAAVTVTATDPGGLKATQNIAVTVEPPENRPPRAVGTIAARVLTEGGSRVTVGVSGAFRDPDGDALSYAAESSDDLVATATVSGSEVTIRPVSAGNAAVTVTATDPGGLKATQNIAVTVEPPENRPPRAVGTIAAQVLIEGGSRVTVGVSGAFRDPDGDALSYAAESSDDLVATATVSDARVTIRPVSTGSVTVTVTATDPGGLKATQDIAVSVEPPENRPPRAVGLIAARVLTEGGSQVTVGVSGAFRDPDGNALSYAARSSDVQVATATVSVARVTIRPVSAGSATVTVTASDSGGLKATQTIAVSVEPPENRPPRAVGSIAAQVLTEGGSQVEVGVSRSFRDPDGDALSYAAESSDDLVATATVSDARVTIRSVSTGSVTVTVTATDPGGLKATQDIAVSVEPPENRPPRAVGLIAARVLTEGGSQVTVGVSGAFRDPDGNALSYAARSSDVQVATATVSVARVTIRPVSAGSATVTVTASDSGGLKATQTIAVSVEPPENRPPRAVGSIAAQVLTEGGSQVEVGVSRSFRDPDGDALSYAAESSDDLVATVTVSGSEVTIRPVSAGSATVMVTATDPGRLKATQDIAVTVEPPENQPPQAEGSMADQTVETGAEVSVDISDAFSDPDDDELRYSAVSDNSDVATASTTGTSVVVTGVVAGSTDITVTATDPGGLTATQNIAVTVEPPENRRPQAVGSMADQTVETGAEVSVDISDAFSDLDDDELRYSAVSDNSDVATASTTGTSVVVTGVVAGSTDITVTATDPGGLDDSQSFTVTVTDDGGPSISINVTYCELTGRWPDIFQGIYRATIRGTITSNRNLTRVYVRGWVNYDFFVGTWFMAEMERDVSIQYQIIGNIKDPGSDYYCEVEASAFTAAAFSKMRTVSGNSHSQNVPILE